MSKRLRIYDDPRLPSGSVVIAVAPPELSSEQVGVAIARRNADRPHLGPFGWQASEHSFQPLQVRNAGGSTELVFGSELTRELAVDMDVVVTIAADGIRERHFWPDIASELGDRSLLLDMPDRRPIKRPEQRPPQVGQREEVALQANEADPPTIVDPETVPVDEPSKPTGRKRAALFSALAFLFLCIALAIGVFRYLSPSLGEPHIDPQAVATHAGDTPAPQTPPEPSPEPAPVVEQAHAAPPPNFASRYRQYLDQQGHADELLTLGHEALSANETNVGFNAITLSADRGSPAAKFLMGQWYDPLSPERQLVSANPNNAAVYYGDAAALGSEEARSALRKLCEAAAVTVGPAPSWASDFDRKTYCQ